MNVLADYRRHKSATYSNRQHGPLFHEISKPVQSERQEHLKRYDDFLFMQS